MPCTVLCPSISLSRPHYHSTAHTFNVSCLYFVQPLTLVRAWTFLMMRFLCWFSRIHFEILWIQIDWLASLTRPPEGSCPLDGIWYSLQCVVKILHSEFYKTKFTWTHCSVLLWFYNINHANQVSNQLIFQIMTLNTSIVCLGLKICSVRWIQKHFHFDDLNYL